MPPSSASRPADERRWRVRNTVEKRALVLVDEGCRLDLQREWFPYPFYKPTHHLRWRRRAATEWAAMGMVDPA
jgi:hypothetical protein